METSCNTISYEYFMDEDWVYHPVHRNGTPWRWNDHPIPYDKVGHYTSEIWHMLPSEDMGAIWGDPVDFDSEPPIDDGPLRW